MEDSFQWGTTFNSSSFDDQWTLVSAPLSSFADLFTGGDVATGPALVVDAIGGGRRAARSIHQYLTEEEIKGDPKSLLNKHIGESLFDSVPGVEKKKRTPMPELEVADRIDSMIEVDQVITEDDAAYESKRCLGCCRLCYNPETDFPIANA